MVYADYEFYKEEFLNATVPEDKFAGYAEKASALIDSFTFDRITDDIFVTSPKIGRKIKLCCCALCEEILLIENGGGISSESVDGYSVTYASGISKSRSEMRRYSDTIKVYLSGTGLLYRGQ